MEYALTPMATRMGHVLRMDKYRLVRKVILKCLNPEKELFIATDLRPVICLRARIAALPRPEGAQHAHAGRIAQRVSDKRVLQRANEKQDAAMLHLCRRVKQETRASPSKPPTGRKRRSFMRRGSARDVCEKCCRGQVPHRSYRVLALKAVTLQLQGV